MCFFFSRTHILVLGTADFEKYFLAGWGKKNRKNEFFILVRYKRIARIVWHHIHVLLNFRMQTIRTLYTTIRQYDNYTNSNFPLFFFFFYADKRNNLAKCALFMYFSASLKCYLFVDFYAVTRRWFKTGLFEKLTIHSYNRSW